MMDKNRGTAEADRPPPMARAHDTGAPISVNIHIPELGYDGAVLARNLDLTLGAGETTCLLGPSGVGKSSLLRTLAGLLSMPGGQRITCSDGRALSGRLSYMAQSDLLLPWASVAENLTIGFRLRGEALPMAAVMDMLKQVSLQGTEHVLPAQLSGGMRQRVALARTLLEERSVVLMDEPFSALDALTRHDLHKLTKKMLRNRTVLLITHDPMEAFRLGSRIYILRGAPATLSQPLEFDSALADHDDGSAIQLYYNRLMAALAGENEQVQE